MKVKVDITSKNMTVKSQKISTEDTCDEKDNSSTEKLYKRYQECRDQELQRFWQNSTYIWTFLALCFTGYGVLLVKFTESKINTYFTLLSIFISFVAIILSILWLKMINASKTWYEVYENAIWEIESVNNTFNCNKDYLIHNFWATKDKEKTGSPSKIMRTIGVLLIVFWILALIFGVLSIFKDKIKGGVKDIIKNLDDGNILCCMIAFIIGAFIAWLIMKLWKRSTLSFFESSTIRDEEENNLFKKIKQDLDIILSENEHIYYEIKKEKNERYVDFIFTNKNIDYLDNITSLFGIQKPYENNKIRYKYMDIDNHYKNIGTIAEQKMNVLKQQFNFRSIFKKNDCIILVSSEINSDFETICNLVQCNNKIKIEDNKIIIPLDCIP